MEVRGSAPERLLLRSLLDTYGYTAGLKDGSVHSWRVGFDFDEVRPIYDGFPRTIRTDEFALSELSTATFFQSLRFEKPLLLLPIGLLNRFHHGSIVHNTERGLDGPGDLAGRRVAVRSYTQTTAVWVRGILETDHGVDPRSVTWITFEDAHCPEYRDPPNAIRAAAGQTLERMLLDGEVDAAVIGRIRPDDARVQNLIVDAAQAEWAWHARTGVLPINHMLVIRRETHEAHPWLVAEIGSMLAENRDRYVRWLQALADSPGSEPTTLGRDDRFRLGLVQRGIDPVPFGVAAVRPALELLADFCVRQGLVPELTAVEELFDPDVAGAFESGLHSVTSPSGRLP